jgi:nucleoid DNA-binding protein
MLNYHHNLLKCRSFCSTMRLSKPNDTTPGGRRGQPRAEAAFSKTRYDMRKIELARRIAEDTELTYTKAEEAVDAILDAIKTRLSAGESVILRRFGTFDVRSKGARVGRNPKTGEVTAISARRVVRFKSGKRLKASVNDPVEVG